MLSQGHKAAFQRGYKALAVAGLAALAACGGGGGNSVTMPTAFGIFGQADYTHSGANRSNPGIVAKNGIGNSFGGVAVVNTATTKKFYVVDTSNSRILGWNSVPQGSEQAIDQNADFVLGQLDFASNQINQGNSLPTNLTLSEPNSIYTDGTRLVVADSGNNRVLIWDTLPSASNAPPDHVFGQLNFTANSFATTPAGMKSPFAAVIAGGKLLVTDRGNNRVMVWNNYAAAANGAAADVFMGQADGNGGSSGLPTQSSLNGPAGLWSNSQKLLVADTGNNRLMYWEIIPVTQPATLALNAASQYVGQPDPGSRTPGTSKTGLTGPVGVSSDGTTLFVADSGNNRVLRYDSFPPQIPNTAASAVFGQDSLTGNSAPNDDDQNGQPDVPNGGTSSQPSARTLNQPQGVTLISGVLYITDTSNHRIMLFNPLATD